MAPAPAPAPAEKKKAIGGLNSSGTPSYQGGDLSLCTPRDFPTLIPAEGLCSSNCESPNSVCSGLKHEGSATSEENNASSQAYQAAMQMQAGQVAGTSSGSSSAQANIVKDILSSAASDKNVRNFLVSVASSSSAATVKVLLEAFVPSWLLSDRIKASGNNFATGAAGAAGASLNGSSEVTMDTKSDVSRQRMYAFLCATFVVLVAMWMYKSKHNLNEYYSASSGFYAPLS